MNKNKILYWVLTLSFTLPMLISSILYLTGAEEILAGFVHLGYPLYLVKILGTAKFLGVLAILFGRNTILKEWAYAGFTFNILGASASHAFAGDSHMQSLMPLVFLGVLLGSYYLWKPAPHQKRVIA